MCGCKCLKHICENGRWPYFDCMYCTLYNVRMCVSFDLQKVWIAERFVCMPSTFLSIFLFFLLFHSISLSRFLSHSLSVCLFFSGSLKCIRSTRSFASDHFKRGFLVLNKSRHICDTINEPIWYTHAFRVVYVSVCVYAKLFAYEIMQTKRTKKMF